MPEGAQVDQDETPTPPQSFGRPDTNLSDKADDTDPKNDPKLNPGQGIEEVIPGVQIQEANTPFELKPTDAESKSGKYIRYTGPALVRIMDEAAWKGAHVDSDRYFEWNYLNHKRIPMEAFTDSELQYLLRIDGRFELVQAKAKDDEKSSETTE